MTNSIVSDKPLEMPADVLTSLDRLIEYTRYAEEESYGETDGDGNNPWHENHIWPDIKRLILWRALIATIGKAA